MDTSGVDDANGDDDDAANDDAYGDANAQTGTTVIRDLHKNRVSLLMTDGPRLHGLGN